MGAAKPGRYVRVAPLVYKVTASGRFQARVQLGGEKSNRYVSAEFDTLDEAKAWQAESNARRLRGEEIIRPARKRDSAPDRKPIVFGDFVEQLMREWYDRTRSADHRGGSSRSGAVRPATLASYRRRLDTHILPVWGRVQLTEMTAEKVNRWAAGLARKGYARSTQQEILGLFGSIVRHAVARGYLDRDITYEARPIEPVKPLRQKASEDAVLRPLTWPEVAAIADSMHRDLRPALWTQWLLGLRSGELCGLRLSNLILDTELDGAAGTCGGIVDFSGSNARQRTWHAEVSISEHGKVEANSTVADVEWTKTNSSRRRIPVPTVLARLLRQHIDEHHKSASDDSHVFRNTVGSPLTPASWAALFDSAASRAGLGFDPTGDAGLEWKLVPHFSRKNLNTWLALADVSGPVRSRILGHTLNEAQSDRRSSGGRGDAAILTDTIYRIIGDAELVSAMSVIDRAVRDKLGDHLGQVDVERWITVTEAAETLGLTRQTVRRMIQDGLLVAKLVPATHRRNLCWHIDPSSLRDALETETAHSDNRLSMMAAAAEIGVSAAWVSRAINAGDVHAERVRVGRQWEYRISPAEVQRIKELRDGKPRRLSVRSRR
jgi:excisionase family DNA binding protein